MIYMCLKSRSRIPVILEFGKVVLRNTGDLFDPKLFITLTIGNLNAYKEK